jgi:hypothetical protein
VKRLDKLVIRVPAGLDETLTDIAGRLFDETEKNHLIAAVVRGLITLGLAEVARNDVLAPLFVGVLEARGRKKSARR